jgi:alpha-tubulin suppressor-like RCC1 family protein
MTRLWLLAPLALAACTTEITPLELAGPPVTVTAGSAVTFQGGTGETVATPVSVVVVDANGTPTPAIPIDWTVSRGTLNILDDSTDASGKAQASWTLPSTPGTDQVTASIAGVGSVTFTATVTPISGTVVFRYLDAGSYHACGITTTEQLVCWGYGADGQLGLGTTEPHPFPALIPSTPRFRQVSGGKYHACALTLAGLGYCWGSSADGRLGDGSSGGQSNSPTAVRSDSSTQITFREIKAGRLHSCAIDLAQNGWCWGYNGEGEIGVGAFGPGSREPFATLVQGAGPLKSLALGGLHTCAITATGGATGPAQCWGYNAHGQLGDGGTTTTGTPVTVAGGLNFLVEPAVIFPSPDPDFPLPVGPFLAAGEEHSCGITTIGTRCWGLNQDGQLGNGSTTTSSTPVPVTGSFVAITAGLRHTCALTATGGAFCWGANTFGQLGDGSNTARTSPTAVAGGLAFAYLKAGDLSTCGVTSTGVAYCWGDNEYGQLGDGTTTSSPVPVKVAFQP